MAMECKTLNVHEIEYCNSQNKYEKFDLNIEYSDSIKMKSDDLETPSDEETDEFD